MNVLSLKTIRDAQKRHPNQRAGLDAWYKLMTKNTFASFADVGLLFGQQKVDKVGQCYVFDVGGNALRVVVKITFSNQRCYVKQILTHAEYDKGKWYDTCNCDT